MEIQCIRLIKVQLFCLTASWGRGGWMRMGELGVLYHSISSWVPEALLQKAGLSGAQFENHL